MSGQTTEKRLDMRENMLRLEAEETEQKERFVRGQLAVMEGKDTPFKTTIEVLAEAHKEAAAVYRRRIEELR